MKILLPLFISLFLYWTSPLMADEGTKAKASLEGTTEGSPVKGVVDLEETKDGLKVQAKVANVPDPGPHGFHIHEVGSCADEGKAAGSHYNPMGSPHGLVTRDGHEKAHVGDMGNITIDEKGEGILSVVLPHVTLTNGAHNVAGLSIILHEKADDFSQPTGNAGGRIGCGIIEIVK